VAPGPVSVEALYFPADQMRAVADDQVVRARFARAADGASAPPGSPRDSSPQILDQPAPDNEAAAPS
jgi:hypothetical protein